MGRENTGGRVQPGLSAQLSEPISFSAVGNCFEAHERPRERLDATLHLGLNGILSVRHVHQFFRTSNESAMDNGTS